MPLQLTLFDELCRFHYMKKNRLDDIARVIRRYFNPQTYRAGRKKGSLRHQDLFGLSVEEVVTFFDEVVTNKKEGYEEAKMAATELQKLIVELITYLSINGNPGQNSLLKKFVQRLAQTDVIVTFNWDTILDRAIESQRKFSWHRSWGYGKTVRENLESFSHDPPKIPNKYPRLLKLHGSINWTSFHSNGEIKSKITNGWHPGDRVNNVLMMPPKMIKREVWDNNQTFAEGDDGANTINATPSNFYSNLWAEAEGQLSHCRRLVFIGYSFPPADFAVSNMIRRAISEMKVSTGKFPTIDIVDPNVSELSQRFQRSFKISVNPENQYLSLSSYLHTQRAK